MILEKERGQVARRHRRLIWRVKIPSGKSRVRSCFLEKRFKLYQWPDSYELKQNYSDRNTVIFLYIKISMGSDSIDFEKVMNCYEIVFKKLVRYLGSE